MIKVFECLGVQTFEKDGKKGTNIYYSEPFDDSEKNCSGVKCNHLFTYKNITVPKPGERFKAMYSLGFDFKNQWVDFVSFLNTLIYFLIGIFYGILLF